jgi:hypothetical protein
MSALAHTLRQQVFPNSQWDSSGSSQFLRYVHRGRSHLGDGRFETFGRDTPLVGPTYDLGRLAYIHLSTLPRCQVSRPLSHCTTFSVYCVVVAMVRRQPRQGDHCPQLQNAYACVQGGAANKGPQPLRCGAILTPPWLLQTATSSAISRTRVSVDTKTVPCRAEFDPLSTRYIY